MCRLLNLKVFSPNRTRKTHQTTHPVSYRANLSIIDRNFKKSCFYAPPPESGGVLCYTLRNFECPSVRLSVRPSVRPSVSAHHHSCIGNSSYSFRPILLKLYRCFKDGLKICILFFQNPEIIFYHFFPIFNLDIFRALYYRYVYGVCTLYRQLLLQFLANPFETLQVF